MEGEARPPDSLFWVEPDAVEGGTLRLSPDESHHLTRVFRAAPGTHFEAVDGRGRCFHCLLVSAGREGAVGRVLGCREEEGELPAPLKVAAGMPEPTAAEELVARAIPLGASQIVFFPAERGERWKPTAPRVARFDRVARAALKQCRRSRLPSIQFLGSPAEAIEAARAGVSYLADPEGRSWSECAAPGVSSGVVLGIGPPGGLTGPERALFRSAGYVAISLGPSRLTTPDAASAMLSLAREQILSARGARH